MSIDTNLKTTIRHEKKRQRLRERQCTQCGETDLRMLQQTEVVLCAECRLTASGMPTMEQHHPPGRHNNPFTAPLPANAHAALSDTQVDWPTATLRNPDGDFLRSLAGWLRFFADTFRYLSTEAHRWATELEHRADYVAAKLGPQWWTAMPGGAA